MVCLRRYPSLRVFRSERLLSLSDNCGPNSCYQISVWPVKIRQRQSIDCCSAQLDLLLCISCSTSHVYGVLSRIILLDDRRMPVSTADETSPSRMAVFLYGVVILNFIAFIMIAIGQLLIYLEIKKNSKRMKTMTTNRKKDLTIARNLLLVLTTDFMCWFPIGIIGNDLKIT